MTVTQVDHLQKHMAYMYIILYEWESTWQNSIEAANDEPFCYTTQVAEWFII